MPIFEYACKACDTQFETLVSPSRPAACPACGSTKLEKKLSAFAVGATASPAPASGPCGTCGDPRGAGACSLN